MKKNKKSRVDNTEYMRQNLSFVVAISFFCVIIALIFNKIDATQHETLGIMIGVLGTSFVQVYQYYFGSSYTRSKKHDDSKTS